MSAIFRSRSRIVQTNGAADYYDRLEVEVVDVVLGEDEDVAEHDLAIDDFAIAEAAGLEGGVARLVLAGRNRFSCEDGEIAKVLGVPEDDRFHGAVHDVLFHIIGGGEAGDLHFAGHALLFDGFRRAGEGGGADGPDALEIRMALDQRLRHLLRLGLIVIGRFGGDEREVGILGQLLLHVLDPLVLIGGGEGGGDDGDFAAGLGGVTIADILGEGVNEGVADLLGRGLIHEEGAGIRSGVGIPSDDLHALRFGGLHRRSEYGGIIHRDGDHIGALQRPLLDKLCGFVRLAADRAFVSEVHIAKLLGGLGSALGAGFKIRNTLLLGEQIDVELLAGGGGIGAGCGGGAGGAGISSAAREGHRHSRREAEECRFGEAHVHRVSFHFVEFFRPNWALSATVITRSEPSTSRMRALSWKCQLTN